MEQITIIKRDGTTIDLFSKDPFCTVKSAVQNSNLMGDDTVTLNIISSQQISFEKGDKIIVHGDEYYIRAKVNREMFSDSHFSYEPVFYGVMYELMKALYRNTDSAGVSTKNDFDLTYSISDFVKVLIYNMNRDYPGIWVFDEANCPETEPITMQFSSQNCLQALQNICKQFKLEFQITQSDGVRTIHIGTFGQVVTPPAGNSHFEWGKGNGLFKLKEQKVDDKAIVTRLWVEGGNKNIRSDYRNYSERLQLPYPQRLNTRSHTLKDGTVIAAGSQTIGITDDSKRYIEDVALSNQIGVEEDVKKYDISPERTGTISSLVDGDILSFIDDSMDFDINAKDQDGNTLYLIPDTSAKITFITGKLAGQQFELKSYDHAAKKFTILSFTDERGLTIPTVDSEAFRMAVSNTYKITDIKLPTAYENNAEEDLWYAGYEDYLDLKQARAQYVLTFDRKYFLESAGNDSETSIFQIGDYVPVKDTRFGIEKNIRINKVSRNLLIDFGYTLTLSDTTAISIQSQTVLDVIEHNVIINNNRLRDLAKAKRGWRTTEELRTMVYDPDGYFDNENIRPNSIDTNMLTVGAKSQQFVITGTVFEANYQGNGNKFKASAGVLSHLSIQKSELSAQIQSAMGSGEIPSWIIIDTTFTLSDSGGYYLFAKCSKSALTGTWFVSQQQLKADDPTYDANNYYFQVGIIGAIYEDGWRDFSTTYGFSRINGNTITTGKIVTIDGYSYLDLDGNKFKIGDSQSYIDYNVTNDRQITLMNVILKSQSGDQSPIGVFRGVFNNSYVYYKGDEVFYTDNGETCTYRYNNDTPASGKVPTNSTYWAVISKGSKGETGNSIFYTFNDSTNTPATPTGDGTTGGWHTYSSDAVRWMSVKTAKTIADGSWGAPIKVRGADGTSITIKGTKDSVAQLPTTGNTSGDAYIVGSNLYIWNGTSWSNVGQFKGDAGVSSYLHRKYSNDGGVTFTAGNGETPGRYLGILVDHTESDSDTPSAYTWSDTKGEQGIPGENGEDGRTTYLHIKYSDNGGLSFTNNNGEEPGDYIGQYTDYVEQDSSNPSDYTWALLKGSGGTGGTDAEVSDFYEYRYAKNGSNVSAPAIDRDAIAPAGWSTTMPALGTLEYMWLSMSRKSALVDLAIFHLPILSGETTLQDATGNGHNATLSDGASVVANGDNAYLNMPGVSKATISDMLPFGTRFTLCFWLKTDQSYFKWILNGKYGREYIEKTVNVSAGSWYHFALRFTEKSVSIICSNTGAIQTASLNAEIVGFSMFDDNLFGSSIQMDDIWLFRGALADADITKVYNKTIENLSQQWSVPTRVTPKDGVDGQPGAPGTPGAKGDTGESPAAPFQGIYDSSRTYYGTKYRIDCVKYNNSYYVARIDAGSFSGVLPTNTDKWNPFGAQYESTATKLLLAENADIAGWIFRNNRLESANGSVYLDGVNGSARLDATLQLSTGYSGNISDVNLFFLPARTSNKYITMGYEQTDIGKVCRLYNNSAYGSGGVYYVQLCTFGIKDGSTDATFGTTTARLDPQEVLEVSCFEMPPNSLYSPSFGCNMPICAKWTISGRFGTDQFKQAYAIGRFPRIIAMGRLTGGSTTESTYISGYWYNEESLSNVFSVTRAARGKYTFTCRTGYSLPSGYKIMITGYNTDNIKGVWYSVSNNVFDIYTSDDDSTNDGSVDFIIFAPYWEYPMT